MDSLMIPAGDGYVLLSPEQVMRLEADGGYTWIFMEGGRKHFVSRNIGYLHRLLPRDLFLRCHHKHVVNLSRVVQLIRHGGHRLVLVNGETVEIARRRWNEVMQRIRSH